MCSTRPTPPASCAHPWSAWGLVITCHSKTDHHNQGAMIFAFLNWLRVFSDSATANYNQKKNHATSGAMDIAVTQFFFTFHEAFSTWRPQTTATRTYMVPFTFHLETLPTGHDHDGRENGMPLAHVNFFFCEHPNWRDLLQQFPKCPKCDTCRTSPL